MSTSNYEQVRLDNIRRNELELERLGFNNVKVKVAAIPKVKSKRVKLEVIEYEPERKSLRSSAQRVAGYFSESSQFKLKRNDDDDSDYDDKDELNEVKRYNNETIPAPTRRQRNEISAEGKANRELALLNNSEEEEPVLKLEEALTSRSSCRKCRETIDKGNLRVGMKAWIMGRSSWTWSHPVCFTSLLALSREVSGRGKCKLTSYKFDVGEVKVTCTSHTNTLNLSITAAAKTLENILKEVPSYTVAELISTLGDVSNEEKSKMVDAFEKPIEGALVIEKNDDEEDVKDENSDDDVVKGKGKLSKQDQPILGQKTNSKGQVAW
eukprot:CAMPEP_0119034498 /NCGR_PEP_ID=MMETSP1177-20130426/1479_1 /TAXON_ID=2985 /ORGANISM="Ochromonas sp, Strain CCMP1899" /LENGTH=323 /DNA_ID=CAMNT_0006991963 /DNA_START=20 /DNA_END=988 /DNA_ORIENTATION=-